MRTLAVTSRSVASPKGGPYRSFEGVAKMRAEQQIIGTPCFRRLRFCERMARDADPEIRRRQLPYQIHRHGAGSQMHAVGICGQSDIEAIIHSHSGLSR